MKSGIGEPARRGRPRDAAKRATILDAARRLFLAHGFDGVALDVVIAEAGTSKTTFYANFADRSALVEAVIHREADRVIHADADPPGAGLEVDLTAFGERLLALLTHPELIGLERMIATAAHAHPTLAHRFFEAGPGRSFAALVERIETGMATDELRAGDARAAAEDLIGLWLGFMRVELGILTGSAPDERSLRARAKRGVTQFLRLWA